MYLLKQDQCYLVLWEICHYFMTFNQECNSTPRNEQKNRNCKETMNGHNHFYMHADPEPSLTTIHGLCVPNKKCASIKSEGTRVHRERYEFCSDGNNGQNVKHSTLGSTTYTLLKHLTEPWHTTSHTCPSDSAAISQHDSLNPVRRHLLSYTHVTNNKAFVDLMKLGLMQ